MLIEGNNGSIQLTPGNEIRVTTPAGTTKEIVTSNQYQWADPDYAVVQSSIVDTQMNILQGLQGGHSETTGADNYETMKLVWGAYDSAAHQQLIQIKAIK